MWKEILAIICSAPIIFALYYFGKAMLKRFRKKYEAYELRKEVAAWVEKNIGAEYVEESLNKYDKINSGVPIGGFMETVAFLDMVEKVKEQATT